MSCVIISSETSSLVMAIYQQTWLCRMLTMLSNELWIMVNGHYHWIVEWIWGPKLASFYMRPSTNGALWYLAVSQKHAHWAITHLPQQSALELMYQNSTGELALELMDFISIGAMFLNWIPELFFCLVFKLLNFLWPLIAVRVWNFCSESCGLTSYSRYPTMFF